MTEHIRRYRMNPKGDCEPSQVEEAEEHHYSLPAPVASREGQCRQCNGRDWHTESGIDSKFCEGECDGSKLRDQRQEVDQQQICERETAPPFSEPAVDHGRMPLTCSDPKADHHLLDEVRDGQKQ